jgi:predicted phosphodiesterase
MKEPVRILSDLHLGHQVSRIERTSALRPLIAGAGTVVFNGDTWQELAAPFKVRAEQMLDELRALCAEEGADAVFLPGNHDPGWQGRGWVELAEGRIVVTHGDALYFDGSPWKREVLTAEKQVLALWSEYPAAAHDLEERLVLARRIAKVLCSVEYPLGRHILQRAWDAVMPPLRALKMLEAWYHQGPMGNAFCEQYFPQAGLLVIGHFHHQGIWTSGRRTVINTGSFLDPGKALWLDWNQRWLTCGEIDESPELCRIGRKLATWRFPEMDSITPPPDRTGAGFTPGENALAGGGHP